MGEGSGRGAAVQGSPGVRGRRRCRTSSSSSTDRAEAAELRRPHESLAARTGGGHRLVGAIRTIRAAGATRATGSTGSAVAARVAGTAVPAVVRPVVGTAGTRAGDVRGVGQGVLENRGAAVPREDVDVVV